MKHVAMVAHLFPPEGNAGAYRPLRFVRALVQMGWQTSVITAEPYWYERYDPSLLQLVPQEADVVRVPVRDAWLAFQAHRRKGIQQQLRSSGGAAERLRVSLHSPWRSRLRNAVRALEAAYYRPDVAVSWVRPATAATLICAGGAGRTPSGQPSVLCHRALLPAPPRSERPSRMCLISVIRGV